MAHIFKFYGPIEQGRSNELEWEKLIKQLESAATERSGEKASSGFTKGSIVKEIVIEWISPGVTDVKTGIGFADFIHDLKERSGIAIDLRMFGHIPSTVLPVVYIGNKRRITKRSYLSFIEVGTDFDKGFQTRSRVQRILASANASNKHVVNCIVSHSAKKIKSERIIHAMEQGEIWDANHMLGANIATEIVDHKKAV